MISFQFLHVLTNSFFPRSLGAGLTFPSVLDPGGDTKCGSAATPFPLNSRGLAASTKPLKAATNSSHAIARLSKRNMLKAGVLRRAGEMEMEHCIGVASLCGCLVTRGGSLGVNICTSEGLRLIPFNDAGLGVFILSKSVTAWTEALHR